MVLSYSTALAILDVVADDQRGSWQDAKMSIPLEEAVGRVAGCDLISNESTPAHDTSAMDGYAIRSESTRSATPETPVRFRVRGRIAAGDDPRQTVQEHVSAEIDMKDVEPCIEIMTGAIFPDGFDACVKYEDTLTVVGEVLPAEILVTKPLARNANRRLTGSDVNKGDTILTAGTILQVSHVLPLASLGFVTVPVVAKPRVAVFSTGKELLSQSYGLARDINGPYLTTALNEIGAEVDFGGILDDDAAMLYRRLQTVARSGAYDVIITSGAVSKGRFDHVPAVLAQMDAEILFHGVAIRPGHPVLFALLPSGQSKDSKRGRKTALFGLPGNPGAAAACFRFLVVPYLRRLTGQAQESPIIASLESPVSPTAGNTVSCNSKRDGATTQTTSPDLFRHGVLLVTARGGLTVTQSREQSPAKLGPFATVNCWIHSRPHGQSKLEAGLAECYPISAAFPTFPTTHFTPL